MSRLEFRLPLSVSFRRSGMVPEKARTTARRWQFEASPVISEQTLPRWNLPQLPKPGKIVELLRRDAYRHVLDTRLLGSQLRLERPLFHFLLTSDAIPRPRHRFESFLLKFLMAGNTLSEAVVANPLQCVIDKL